MVKSDFNYFVKTIPPDMYSRTKATICRHIAIFEPEEYAVGEVLCVDDYHFVLFSQAHLLRESARLNIG